MIYGIRPLEEISKTTGFYPSDVVYIAQRSPHIRLKRIIGKAKRSGARVEMVDAGRVNSLAKQKKNQGVLLARKETSTYPQVTFDELLRQTSGLYVLIERLNDPQNLGSLIRSMVAFDCRALIINKKKTPPLGPAAWKVSAGALSQLPVLWINGCGGFIAKFRTKNSERSLCFIGADTHGESASEKNIQKILQAYKKIFLVMGDEERGISRELKSKLDISLRIPHSEKINSLNVGVAAGILLHSLQPKGAWSSS